MNVDTKPADRSFRQADVVIVGGGIYGLMVALEASKKGQRVILLERETVGGATSANWFRILHGGLRYLQTFDLPRFRESVAERRWFQQFAPDLVRPLRFLMPLYGQGMRRPAVFRAAFAADAALGWRRNAGLRADQALPRGRVLDAAATRAFYPGVRSDALQGGALWHDVIANDGEKLMARIRERVEAQGAWVLEYAEALDLVLEQDSIAGVTARYEGETQIFRAPVVINAAGPWNALMAERFDRSAPELFRPTLAFNLLLNKTPPADIALAVSPSGTTDPTLFVYPQQGRTFAGTWYAPWERDIGPAEVPEAEIDAFLATLNRAAPALDAQRKDIEKIYPGLLPAETAGGVALADREIVRDHAAHGGPKGLFSVSGVKFTTARRVAEKLVRQLPRRANTNA